MKKLLILVSVMIFTMGLILAGISSNKEETHIYSIATITHQNGEGSIYIYKVSTSDADCYIAEPSSNSIHINPIGISCLPRK